MKLKYFTVEGYGNSSKQCKTQCHKFDQLRVGSVASPVIVVSFLKFPPLPAFKNTNKNSSML